MRIHFLPSALLLALPFAASAQQWEIGGVGGFAAQRGVTVESGSVSGKVGFKDSATAGAYFGETRGRWGGEVRYLYRWGDAKVEVGGESASLKARQHIVTGDLLYYFTKEDAAVRPFVVFGGGVRRIEGTGAQQAFHPGSQYAALAQSSDTLPVGHFGAGIKARAGKHALFRLDFRDYLGPRTENVIAAAPGAKLKGLMHDLIFTAGIAWVF
jgi:hypothetical protein